MRENGNGKSRWEMEEKGWEWEKREWENCSHPTPFLLLPFLTLQFIPLSSPYPFSNISLPFSPTTFSPISHSLYAFAEGWEQGAEGERAEKGRKLGGIRETVPPVHPLREGVGEKTVVGENGWEKGCGGRKGTKMREKGM